MEIKEIKSASGNEKAKIYYDPWLGSINYYQVLFSYNIVKVYESREQA